MLRSVARAVILAFVAPILTAAGAQMLNRNPVPEGTITSSDYAARRDAVTATVDSGIVLAFGAVEPVVDWPNFFQVPTFQYLTGFGESDAVLVIVKRKGGLKSTMFVPTQSPVVARWVGERTAPRDLQGKIGIAGRDIAQLRPTVDSLVATGLPVYVVPDIHNGDYVKEDSLTRGGAFIKQLRVAHPSLVPSSLHSAVNLMRARKSPAEIALLRRAAEISARGHREAMKAAAPGCGENEIQAILDGTFRRLGGDRPGYGSIVGSGRNATTLHYSDDNDMLRDGDLILIDAATLFDHYTADVTRTFPVNGKFTPAQRDLYQLVRDAQEAFVRQIEAGTTLKSSNDAGKAIISSGLTRFGLIESPTATFDGTPDMKCPEGGCPQLNLFALHGYGGHGIGLEVHDPAQYYVAPGLVSVGDVFTVEPGVYVSPEFIALLPDTPKNRAMRAKIGPAVEKYKWLGVRIEDDYAMTDKGLEWLSSGVPREINEIEALMSEPQLQLPGGGTCGTRRR